MLLTNCVFGLKDHYIKYISIRGQHLTGSSRNEKIIKWRRCEPISIGGSGSESSPRKFAFISPKNAFSEHFQKTLRIPISLTARIHQSPLPHLVLLGSTSHHC
jgi:hypothetical protein